MLTGSMNGNGSGGPGGPGGPGDQGNQQQQQQQNGGQPDWAAFSQSISDMGTTLGDRLSQELGGRLDRLHQTVEDGRPQPQPVDPNAGFDFDAATPRQLYDHMTAQFTSMMENTIKSVLDNALGPYADEITGIRRDLATDQGGREIDRLEQQNKDFKDWVPEMKALATKHPSLSIGELFNLSKANDPAKAKALDAKYNPPPPPPARPFSLAPQRGDNGQSAPKPMSKEEASLDAWRQVNERHPGVLASLEDRFPGM